jgi:hypothetical protein
LLREHDTVNKFLYYKLIYFAIPVIAPPIDVPSAAPCSDTAGPKIDPILSPTNEPTLQPMLPLSDAVTLHPDAISVNRQKQNYISFKILPVINIKM